MIKNFIFVLLAILLAFAIIGLFSLVGAVIVFGSAWLLLFVAPLTFFQASLLCSSVMLFIVLATQRDLDLDFISTIMHAVVLVPSVSFILNAVTWIINRFVSLSYEETLLITASVALPILYTSYLAIWKEIRRGDNQDEDDEYDYDDDDEYDYDYEDEEEEEDLTPKIRFRNKKSSQYTPEDILEELKKASQKANEPCYCGSGKKYRRCHGRKSWR